MSQHAVNAAAMLFCELDGGRGSVEGGKGLVAGALMARFEKYDGGLPRLTSDVVFLPDSSNAISRTQILRCCLAHFKTPSTMTSSVLSCVCHRDSQ